MLENIQEVKFILESYISNYPQEESRLNDIIQFVHNIVEDNQLYDRKNFVGHITASAFILSHDRTKILLLHHKSLNRWLQPGGHVDLTDPSIYNAALREMNEETGLSFEDIVELESKIPFDIDSHYIPPNPRKNEDAHVHHDIRYVFITKENKAVSINSDESNSLKWVVIADLVDDETFGGVASKLSGLNCLN